MQLAELEGGALVLRTNSYGSKFFYFDIHTFVQKVTASDIDAPS